VPLITQETSAQALVAAERAAALRPDSIRVVTVLAFARFRAGQPERAREAARRVIELDPDNRDVRPLLGD
jgi:Flp pilus assembly protein TadD